MFKVGDLVICIEPYDGIEFIKKTNNKAARITRIDFNEFLYFSKTDGGHKSTRFKAFINPTKLERLIYGVSNEQR
jgi:hypothetical protein